MDRRRRSRWELTGRPTPKDPGPGRGPVRQTVYEIRVKGHLDDRYAEWHEGLTVTREETGNTLLTAPVVDQAALHGLLRKLRDLGVPLLSINPAGPEPPGDYSSKEESS